MGELGLLLLLRAASPTICYSPKVRLNKTKEAHQTKILESALTRVGNVAQLVENQIGMPPTQVQFPGAGRDFSPRVNLKCRLSYGIHTPLCAITCTYICPCQSLVDYGNTKAPCMQRTLGSKTVTAGFPMGRQPEFPMGEIPLQQ